MQTADTLLALLSLVPIIPALLLRRRAGAGLTFLIIAMSVALCTGFLLNGDRLTLLYITGSAFLCLGAVLALFVLLEVVVLPLLGLFRLGALTRVTYHEAIFQPLTLILLICGILAILLLAFMPFFTLSEDSKMYRDVAVSLVFLFTLPVMIFASTKVIDEEIENRTMLILMSKPIARWQVVLGKYLGVLLVCLAMIVALGFVTATCAYMRYFDDMRIDYYVATFQQRGALDLANYKAELALLPALLLQFLQIGTLAAVSVAVSTRWGLAVNVTTVVLLYIAANLARYVGAYNLPEPLHTLALVIAHLLPGLGFLDLNQRLIYGSFNLGDTDYVAGLPSYSQIWQYTAMASVYALLYITAALSFGMAAFRTRELV